MIEILERHISTAAPGCVAARWISTLTEMEQKAFEYIKENSQNIQVAALYKEINKEAPMPFKLTAFRSHLRGYCTCQK